MKIARQILCFLPFAGLAHCAWAQSSVQIYGIADVYLGPVKDTRTTMKIADGGIAASRLGFRGTEDLGGGWQSVFNLEMGMNLDDGSFTLGGGFGRMAFVGLKSPYGTVEMGRGYAPLFYSMQTVDPFTMNVNWSPAQLLSKSDGQGAAFAPIAPPMRLSNLVRYRHGDLSGSGFRFELTAAPGEGAATSGRFVGGTLSYRAENYYVSYSGQRLNTGTNSAVSYHADAHLVNGKYMMGPVTLSAMYGVADADAPGTFKSTLTLLGVTWNLGEHRLLAEFGRRNVSNSTRDNDMLTLGYDYNLSKRTTLYARTLRLNNKGQAAISMGLATVPANSGVDVSAMALGIKHNF
ncbi:porin [Azohydromonas lata]|uniref:porin n=1 Tax=Azohydromonas lata TaxID=45677 RepID=UPI0009FD2051|nr:porin [Azohydromonas lata]